jgi:UDP-N-acetyl-D-mannosaminuronate dehydrogenase
MLIAEEARQHQASLRDRHMATVDLCGGRISMLSLTRAYSIANPATAVNENRKRAMARKVATALGGQLRGKTVAVLGLTFKPDTDDMREAPSIPLVTGLLDMGAQVRAFDPAGMDQARPELPEIEYCPDAYACARDADTLVIVTEWVQFRALDLDRLKRDNNGVNQSTRSRRTNLGHVFYIESRERFPTLATISLT